MKARQGCSTWDPRRMTNNLSAGRREDDISLPQKNSRFHSYRSRINQRDLANIVQQSQQCIDPAESFIMNPKRTIEVTIAAATGISSNVFQKLLDACLDKFIVLLIGSSTRWKWHIELKELPRGMTYPYGPSWTR